MQIDLDYIKKILIAFESSDKAYTNILELQNQGFDIDSEIFIFHIQILYDKNVIANEYEERGIGFSRGGNGLPYWQIVNLRLTATGHDFIVSLKNKEVWTRLQKDFKNTGLSTLLDISKKLLISYLENKIGLK
ncbi:MAG: hypothetical protein KatS3mg028_0880 [Bacteroidia bacterium]|nr:MAG: hypothetical protein KatS3mg028_0880 [Bacteroidia bacterium]